MAFEIEKAVPIPPVVRSRPNVAPTYPFAEMQINDSFAVRHIEGEEATRKTLGKVRSAAGIAAKNLGVRFTIRSMGDHVRVWRIA